jgi:hypothetical protein
VRADVAVQGERIAAVGRLNGSAGRVIDAEGALVTPGFVDIHTHLDAQISWDPLATSPCWHGVTSVVMGNCGVTFAPCKPEDREFLARLMESVEDIPAKHHDGLPGIERRVSVVDRPPKAERGGIAGTSPRWWAMGAQPRAEDAGDPTLPHARDRARGIRAARSLPTHAPSSQDARRRAGARMLRPRRAARSRGVSAKRACVSKPFRTRQHGADDRAQSTDGEGDRATTPAHVRHAQTRQFPTSGARCSSVEKRTSAARILPQTQVRSVGVLFGLVNLTPWDLAGGTWGLLKLIPLSERLAAFRSPEKRAKLIEDSKKSPMGESLLKHFYLLPERDGATRYDLAPEDGLTVIARRGVGPSRPHGHRLKPWPGASLLHEPGSSTSWAACSRTRR